MIQKIMILGAYGNFGKRIAKSLADSGIALILAGRSYEKLTQLQTELAIRSADVDIALTAFDIHEQLSEKLARYKPFVLINTCGPFQDANNNVIKACLSHQVHYIDLADGRDFVNHIVDYDSEAKEKQIVIISGASTVPALSSAVIDYFLQTVFGHIDALKYGVSPGQKAERGLATTQGILSYLGKPLHPYPGRNNKRYGWQDIYRHDYPVLGKRWMANCDVPDLDLFPQHYGIQAIQFSAGMESGLLHIGIWLVSWLIRMGLPVQLPQYAGRLLAFSHQFDRFGTADGGMHMILRGRDHQDKTRTIAWYIIATEGDGPHIPTIPAIILAKKLVHGEFTLTGAMPCIGLVTLSEYLDELKPFHIQTFTMEKDERYPI